MNLKQILFIMSLVLVFLFPTNSSAFYNPLETPNNKYGIHVIDANDLKDAKDLVNSSGGDWGYVTIVIREDDKNLNKWQEVFDQMREHHLIPIVRLATKTSGENWDKFDSFNIDSWVYFLNSLNWVIENRYVIIGNEPNHAKEWGGEINPYEYANIYSEFAEKLKAASDDFFIMPAGLDASAPDNKTHMSEKTFILKMLETNPDIYDYADGWVSHSYPNPNFSGSEFDSGPGTIMTYDWELEYLKSLGIEKNFPVFITETGWAKTLGNDEWLSEEEISKKLTYAFENVWNDPKIVAVTPFLINYKEPLFEMFSWKKNNGENTHFFDRIKTLSKTKGEPVQEVKGQIVNIFTPKITFNDDPIDGLAYVENTGQSIWENGNIQVAVYLNSDRTNNLVEETIIDKPIKPYEKSEIKIVFKPKFIDNNFEGFADITFKDKSIGAGANFNIYKIEDVSSFFEYVIYLKDSISGWIIKNAKGTRI